jgi:hypothetical protein
MESSGLFSHPEEPEVIANPERSAEPVELPAFSDGPRKTTADTPTS